MSTDTAPKFWRDPQLPFIEARWVEDGRQVCYARHSHTVFSIGAVVAGTSTYLHEKTSRTISAGSVVLMNPGEVHACNPIDDQPWSYVMMYVDAQWLAAVQHSDEEGNGGQAFQPLAASYCQSPALFRALLALYGQLVDPAQASLPKHEAAVAFFVELQRLLGGAPLALKGVNPKVTRAAKYIDEHFLQTLRLADICEAANLSEAYLIRAFEQHYHMTPHAYLINRRIQHGQAQLRQGASIAQTALDTGFADQAHFQRVFKKHLAATPGQYKPQ
ncbi:AraC family transcriptional regulator [Pseudomonas sp. nanlin1]|uniref:AraC family transcriptional regulator n=1 Tax=Pseudomonas sp. nanlin1 TaxID=3040605 RepID=UPI00388F371D